VPIADRSEYPLSYYDIVEYMLHGDYSKYQFKRPPEEVSVMVHDYMCHAEKASAIFHPEYGWFVIKAPCSVVAWWKKTHLIGD